MNLRSTDSMSVEALQSKGSSFKNTEVGRVPTDWEVVCLREVANFGGGLPPRKNFEKFYASGTHPWVKTLDLNNGYISSTEENNRSRFLRNKFKDAPNWNCFGGYVWRIQPDW